MTDIIKGYCSGDRLVTRVTVIDLLVARVPPPWYRRIWYRLRWLATREIRVVIE